MALREFQYEIFTVISSPMDSSTVITADQKGGLREEFITRNYYWKTINTMYLREKPPTIVLLNKGKVIQEFKKSN